MYAEEALLRIASLNQLPQSATYESLFTHFSEHNPHPNRLSQVIQLTELSADNKLESAPEFTAAIAAIFVDFSVLVVIVWGEDESLAAAGGLISCGDPPKTKEELLIFNEHFSAIAPSFRPVIIQ